MLLNLPQHAQDFEEIPSNNDVNYKDIRILICVFYT